MADTPTFVLIHGALTDASVWRKVSDRLQRAGHRVAAPSVAMRSLDGDARYLRAFLETLPGPLIVAGHSYAGSIISHPDALTPAVQALVFVAAFQQDAGETPGELNGMFPGSLLTPDNLRFRPYPNGQEVYLRPEKFAEVYAADVDPAEVAIMAAAQKPFDPTILDGTFNAPATWRTLPSWSVVPTSDMSIPTQTLRWMAERAGSIVTEVDASHAVPTAHPDHVTNTILDAAKGISD
ncbi:alpha/beta hydrolase [Actinoallomurus bryophytorum]|uniref:Pimeloyl-ACP methyl ester carboxylesterase n=1 Tax=Actinoallomurus bryophytorum TaxID=1490222 RepID=A0A543BZK6_9ACTN|nr:alpha/beta hydrolase [Actinoallomurus bryophytorum]TQL90264.1 pimeloyl-ACP methyl ester carboxylesterase [Actinoallomurus bryophytorum]